jgi:hypothetical protein
MGTEKKGRGMRVGSGREGIFGASSWGIVMARGLFGLEVFRGVWEVW